MHMVRGHHIVQYAQMIALPGFEKPPPIPLSVPVEFQQKLLLVTAVREVPRVAGYIVSIRSRHTLRFRSSLP